MIFHRQILFKWHALIVAGIELLDVSSDRLLLALTRVVATRPRIILARPRRRPKPIRLSRIRIRSAHRTRREILAALAPRSLTTSAPASSTSAPSPAAAPPPSTTRAIFVAGALRLLRPPIVAAIADIVLMFMLVLICGLGRGW